jgi:hypothetical protein
MRRSARHPPRGLSIRCGCGWKAEHHSLHLDRVLLQRFTSYELNSKLDARIKSGCTFNALRHPLGRRPRLRRRSVLAARLELKRPWLHAIVELTFDQPVKLMNASHSALRLPDDLKRALELLAVQVGGGEWCSPTVSKGFVHLRYAILLRHREISCADLQPLLEA